MCRYLELSIFAFDKSNEPDITTLPVTDKLPFIFWLPITFKELETIKLPVTFWVPITFNELETIKLPVTLSVPIN